MENTLFSTLPLAIQIHILACAGSLVLGALILFRTKGGALHRTLGRVWVAAMIVVALSSFFIHQIRMVGDYSPIHILSIVTLIGLAAGVAAARQRRIRQHRLIMQGLYVGALVIPGLFTLMPGRDMQEMLIGPLSPAGFRFLIAFIIVASVLVALGFGRAAGLLRFPRSLSPRRRASAGQPG